MQEPSTRQLKVGQEVKAILSDIFMRGEIYDPQTMKEINITISEVKVSPDMRNATVYFIPFGSKTQDTKSTMQALANVSGKLKGIIGRKMSIRNIPSLLFRIDNSFEEAKKINDLLSKID